ncbi:MAG: DegT/DnrJ/EryC1/StrS family aminotransferase [Limnochordales bacterium]|nr:DegT/DnrJ/EryC1/StrS family aminotransferase [Limnochordales bacterium]
MQVPVFDLKRQNEALHDDLVAAFERVIRAGQFILGDEVAAFEAEVAALSGVKHGVGVGNCSDALHLVQLALGIGPGDEVITTPFTFFASAGATARLGARPVFVDIDPVTFNLNADMVEAAITPRTKAIVAVHLYGQPVDLPRLRAIADRYGLTLIQDAAQALGARYESRPVASYGHVTCYSFFPTKNLGAFGDGGMVVTDDDELADRLRMLRAHGSKPKYYHHLLGYNSRLDALHAAILRVKLPHLPSWIERRRAIAARYRLLLAGTRPVREGLVTLPAEAPGAEHTYHQFTIRVRQPYRDALRQHLARHGVQTAVYYPLALHLQKVFEPLGYKPGDFPEAEWATSEVLSLPMFPELTDNEIEYVAAVIDTFEPPVGSNA